eukprot:gene7559-8845_t
MEDIFKGLFRNKTRSERLEITDDQLKTLLHDLPVNLEQLYNEETLDIEYLEDIVICLKYECLDARFGELRALMFRVAHHLIARPYWWTSRADKKQLDLLRIVGLVIDDYLLHHSDQGRGADVLYVMQSEVSYFPSNLWRDYIEANIDAICSMIFPELPVTTRHHHDMSNYQTLILLMSFFENHVPISMDLYRHIIDKVYCLSEYDIDAQDSLYYSTQIVQALTHLCDIGHHQQLVSKLFDFLFLYPPPSKHLVENYSQKVIRYPEFLVTVAPYLSLVQIAHAIKNSLSYSYGCLGDKPTRVDIPALISESQSPIDSFKVFLVESLDSRNLWIAQDIDKIVDTHSTDPCFIVLYLEHYFTNLSRNLFESGCDAKIYTVTQPYPDFHLDVSIPILLQLPSRIRVTTSICVDQHSTESHPTASLSAINRLLVGIVCQYGDYDLTNVSRFTNITELQLAWSYDHDWNANIRLLEGLVNSSRGCNKLTTLVITYLPMWDEFNFTDILSIIQTSGLYIQSLSLHFTCPVTIKPKGEGDYYRHNNLNLEGWCKFANLLFEALDTPQFESVRHLELIYHLKEHFMPTISYYRLKIDCLPYTPDSLSFSMLDHSLVASKRVDLKSFRPSNDDYMSFYRHR